MTKPPEQGLVDTQFALLVDLDTPPG